MSEWKAFNVCESEMAATEDLELERQELENMDNCYKPKDNTDWYSWVTFEYYALLILLSS